MISIVTMTRNPTSFHAWLMWHYLLGIDRFVVYADDTKTFGLVQKVVNQCTDQVWVDIFLTNKTTKNKNLDIMFRQMIYVNKAIELLRNSTPNTYLFFIDDDELIWHNGIYNTLNLNRITLPTARKTHRKLLIKTLDQKVLPVTTMNIRNVEARCDKTRSQCIAATGLFSSACSFEYAPSKYHAYVNGKSVVYLGNDPFIKSHGPHFFITSQGAPGPWNNRINKLNTFEDLLILHYDSIVYSKWFKKYTQPPAASVAQFPYYKQVQNQWSNRLPLNIFYHTKGSHNKATTLKLSRMCAIMQKLENCKTTQNNNLTNLTEKMSRLNITSRSASANSASKPRRTRSASTKPKRPKSASANRSASVNSASTKPKRPRSASANSASTKNRIFNSAGQEQGACSERKAHRRRQHTC